MEEQIDAVESVLVASGATPPESAGIVTSERELSQSGTSPESGGVEKLGYAAAAKDVAYNLKPGQEGGRAVKVMLKVVDDCSCGAGDVSADMCVDYTCTHNTHTRSFFSPSYRNLLPRTVHREPPALSQSLAGSSLSLCDSEQHWCPR